jgi:hypothetical protein
MTFGFSNGEQEDVNDSKESSPVLCSLRFQSWESLRCGQRVQSTLTKNKGRIAALNPEHRLIEIDWDNGKHSRASKFDLTKVVLCSVEEI